MQTISLETKIAAPPERCFLLSLSIDLHKESATGTHEEAIAGVTFGLIGLNETVTWRGKHFGLMLTQTTLITRYRYADYFQDVMVNGVFRSFEHDHFFSSIEGGSTVMRDQLRFSAPLGPLGRLAESLVLRSYLTKFLVERNAVIKRVAESEQSWKGYLL